MSSQFTVVAETLGTPGYMASRWGWGAGTASEASDTWSVGCTLFYLLTQLELIAEPWTNQAAQNELYNGLKKNPTTTYLRRSNGTGWSRGQRNWEALAVLLTPDMKTAEGRTGPWKMAAILTTAVAVGRRRRLLTLPLSHPPNRRLSQRHQGEHLLCSRTRHNLQKEPKKSM